MSDEIITAEQVQDIAPQGKSTAVHTLASFDISTLEGMAKAHNASLAADEKVDDHIGDAIKMTGYYIEPREYVNEQTGECEVAPHVLIFDDKGVTYEGTSKGLFISLSNIQNMLNATGAVLDEQNPLPIVFAEKKARMGKMFIVKIDV